MKETRQEALIRLINTEPIGTQEELTRRLSEEGFNATQSTISRDIKKLGLVKSADKNGTVRYTAVPETNFEKGIFMDTVTGADYAGNIAVIKCMNGMAQAVCATIDNMNNPEIVGTIAGDDTIFVLMRCESDAKRLARSFKAELDLKD